MTNGRSIAKEWAIKTPGWTSSLGSKRDRSILVRLLAHLFAWWTLETATSYGTESAGTEPEPEDTLAKTEAWKQLRKPHAAQVISIFRLLNMDCGCPRKQLVHNHLVEIRTGEGKSVTLAMTSTMLALLGCDVDCGCYSDYLSKRDFTAFLAMFTAFGVTEHIKYGTFNWLCEEFINRHGDVREMVRARMKGGDSVEARALPAARARILLIDEVDVFFTKEFYGSVYQPLTLLEDPTIDALVNRVWAIWNDPRYGMIEDLDLLPAATQAAVKRQREKAVSFWIIAKLPEYQKCIARFATSRRMLEELVKSMLCDLKTFEGHDYVVVDDQIGYKEQDGVSTGIRFGCKTMFAHFKEYDDGHGLELTKPPAIALPINSGIFSYAEVPRMYDAMAGVTGTLSTLTPSESKLLEEEFGFTKYTYMPSQYGEQNFDFKENSQEYVIITKAEYVLKELIQEIQKRRRGGGKEELRPVLVFFESKAALEECAQAVTHELRGEVVLMTAETTRAEDKEGLVRQAVAQRSVTFLTREFGRGTDFICYDDTINDLGGVHVIQTFLSASVAEETQARRTVQPILPTGVKHHLVFLKLNGDVMSCRRQKCVGVVLRARSWVQINAVPCLRRLKGARLGWANLAATAWY